MDTTPPPGAPTESTGAVRGTRPGVRDAAEDRWAWRRRIRADRRKYRVYRALVGFVGVLLILLAGATGWLPGPGGIPLALVGLAVLASEFEWARGVLDWAKVKAHDLARWTGRQPTWVRLLGTVATVAAIGVAAWSSLRIFGVPGWAPDDVAAFLVTVPGLG